MYQYPIDLPLHLLLVNSSWILAQRVGRVLTDDFLSARRMKRDGDGGMKRVERKQTQ
jgi:hypothetical protein